MALAERAGNGFIIHPTQPTRTTHNLVSALITMAGSPPAGVPHLDTRRLRATWIVGHLRAGTHVAVLLRAADLSYLSSFDAHMDEVPWPGDDVALPMLRGSQ